MKDQSFFQHILRMAIYGLSSAIGITAFLAPFFSRAVQQDSGQMGSTATSPLLLTALVGLCFLALVFEVQGSMLGAKSVALLGILVAMNATLRFVEVAIPGPGGFSPIFLLIILSGYCFGSSFGFLMGVMTMFISAIITGGVGPWLPYQMFTAGWVGLSTGLLRRVTAALQLQGRIELGLLGLFGAVWGFGYGMIINLWFWPWSTGAVAYYWTPGISVAETVQRYFAFYMLTSFVWDALGAAGNVLLILSFGAPILRTLQRFYDRLVFVYQPEWSSI